MPIQTERQFYDGLRSEMKNEVQSFIPHWRELAQFIQPRRGRFFTQDRNRGGKRHNSIINSAASHAHQVCRSGFFAGIMSPAKPWFAYETPDPDMMDFAPVKEWLWRQELLIRSIFNASNLYAMSPALIGELILFGTGAMSHLDDFENVARFYTHTAGSYVIAQNEKFEVDQICRDYEMTVNQMVKKFGLTNVSQSVKNAYDNGNYNSWRPVTHFILPNPDFRDGNPFAEFMPFRSVYYEPENNEQDKWLERSGFHEFPVYVPRWDLTGEDIYGTDCPAMTALGDVKQLQQQEKEKALGLAMMTRPPLSGPPSLRNSEVNNLPGGLTIYQGDKTANKLESVYNVNLPLQHITLENQEIIKRIQQDFYMDMFLAISNMEGIQPRNQLDLSQRNEERLLQLGPVLERVQGDWLAKMLNRTFNQAYRAGLISPAPPELQGKELNIKFISTLAMAQRSVATTGTIERVAAFTGSIAPWAPNVVEKFDAEQAIDEYSKALGGPPKIIVSDEIVAERRAANQRQQQAAQAAELANSVADTAQKLGNAPTSGRNALTSLSDAIARR